MKANRALLVLLFLNLGIFTLQVVRGQPSHNPAPVIRCRAFELVDDQGRVRAELRVSPAQPDFKMPDGTVGYPETVLFRLVNSHNMPHVKLTASEDGAGMVLGGDGGHVQILSRGSKPFVRPWIKQAASSHSRRSDGEVPQPVLSAWGKGYP